MRVILYNIIMKNVEIILKSLPKSSREQIYLEAAARTREMDSPEWEQYFFSHCVAILSKRLQRIKGIGEVEALEILEAIGFFLGEVND